MQVLPSLAVLVCLCVGISLVMIFIRDLRVSYVSVLVVLARVGLLVCWCQSCIVMIFIGVCEHMCLREFYIRERSRSNSSL